MISLLFKSRVIIFLILISVLSGQDEGLINYKNKNYEEAKKYYEKILTQRENDAAASLGLGASRYQLGDVQNAVKSFQDVLKSEDTEIMDEAYYNIGNTLYEQQKTDESVAFYRKSLELNPGDEDAKFNYELAKYRSNQQQNQDQQNQQDQQDQQNKQNQQQNDQNDNNQEDKPQKTDQKEPDKQEDEDSDSSQQKRREAQKTQKQINAEAILDALKDEEKIHQKVKMAQENSRKLEKDW